MAKHQPTPRQQRRRAARQAAKAERTERLPAVSYARRDALYAAALGLLVLLCYLPAMLWGGFVWDDNTYVKSDPVQEASGLWQIWFSPSAIEKEDHYLPLVYTTFWLEHKLWSFDPTGYHVVNVLLHLSNTLLVWHLMRRLAVPGAWVIAAVFAVHPLHVESVAWVVERKDVLSGLFYLVAVLTWLRFVEKPNSRPYALPLVLYVVALLSKSIAVTLPAALLVGHWWQKGRIALVDVWRLVPFFAVGLIIVSNDMYFSRSIAPVSLEYSPVERVLIAAYALWFYVGKLLWPSGLVVIYPHWDVRPENLLAWGCLIAAVVLVVALWRYRQQLGRGPLAGVLFFAITLSPVLGLVDHNYMKYTFVADRYQYLAGIGVIAVVCGVVAHGARRLPDSWQKGAQIGAVAVVVVLGMLTWKQAGIYRDNETFWRYVIAHNPQARNAHLNLGASLRDQGRHTEALDIARVAVEQRPDHFKAHVLVGEILNKLERFEEAEVHLRRAIEIHPKSINAFRLLANALGEQERYDEMLQCLDRLLILDPKQEDVHANRKATLEWMKENREE